MSSSSGSRGDGESKEEGVHGDFRKYVTILKKIYVLNDIHQIDKT
jgi:hypothetical protein